MGDMNQRGSYAPIGTPETRRSEPFPNLGEMVSECCVSREIYSPFLIFDHIPAPQRQVAIVNSLWLKNAEPGRNG